MLNWSVTEALLFGTLLVFFATTAGALPALLMNSLKDETKSLFLGLSGGVMLGATFFSLLMPALDLLEGQGMSPFFASLKVGLYTLLGAFLLYWFHHLIPHEHFDKVENLTDRKNWNRQALVIMAVALHNLPEGLAVGVGLGSGQAQLGLSLSIAIALQDFPEGLIVALGLKTIGVNFKKILLITALTGVVEAVGVPIGFWGVHLVQDILPIAFALCAGAMLFVISHEVIPESHGVDREKQATFGILIGFVLIMILDRGLSSMTF